jgi:hypothetical protein
MGANIAGIYGAQIFRQEDRPFYRRGFSINIAVLSVGLVLAMVRYADDFLRRRRSKRALQQVGQVDSSAASATGAGASDDGSDGGNVKGVLQGREEVQAKVVEIGGDVKKVPL